MKLKKFNEMNGKKITTEDCVKAICEYLYNEGESGDAVNPKNWKRKSKTGSGTFVREFFNSKTNQTLFVTATDTEILKIDLESGTTADNDIGWYVSKDKDDPSMIALSKDGCGLDDQLGSHNLPQSIIDALNRAGIFGDCEMMEAIWEVNDYEEKTKKAMEKEGFEYCPGLF